MAKGSMHGEGGIVKGGAWYKGVCCIIGGFVAKGGGMHGERGCALLRGMHGERGCAL